MLLQTSRKIRSACPLRHRQCYVHVFEPVDDDGKTACSMRLRTRLCQSGICGESSLSYCLEGDDHDERRENVLSVVL